MARIASLVIADPPPIWAELGFILKGEDCWISGVRHRLGAVGEGIVGWSLADAGDFDLFPTAGRSEPFPAQPTPSHPNGVSGLDHLVVGCGDPHRWVEAIAAAGIDLRRTRRFDGPKGPAIQAFFKLGDIVLELVGPDGPPTDDPPSFFGLAFVVEDLDFTASYLGDRLRPAKDAVQPGRRIATLDKAAGSSVPMAFMSKRPMG